MRYIPCKRPSCFLSHCRPRRGCWWCPAASAPRLGSHPQRSLAWEWLPELLSGEFGEQASDYLHMEGNGGVPERNLLHGTTKITN